jgi:ParB-like chromosome segregation protein Spo0J
MMELRISPEFRDMFPRLNFEEQHLLEISIEEHGCTDTIKTCRGFIVDGHHRYEICTRLCIPYKVEELSFKDKSEVIEWIFNNQVGRRNLPPYHRGLLAIKYLKPLYAARARARMIAGMGYDPVETLPQGKTRDLIAQTVGLSGKQIDKIEFIEAHASGTDRQLLFQGKISINAAFIRTKSLGEKLEQVRLTCEKQGQEFREIERIKDNFSKLDENIKSAAVALSGELYGCSLETLSSVYAWISSKISCNDDFILPINTTHYANQ